MSQVDAVFIRDFMTFHARTHNSRGQHMVFRVLSTFLRWYENEVEPDDWKNPIEKNRAPKLILEVEPPADLGDDVRKMLEICGHDLAVDLSEKAVILFLLDTGVRARELLSMNLDDIDLTIRKAEVKQRTGGKGREVWFRKPTLKAIRS